jgi:DNA-binding helix-hairpin-helix protein with protein kinase domain
LLFDATSNLCVGFTMQRVNARPIHQLYRPKDRKAYFPRATWGFLVHVAKNLTAAFDTLHENGILMADVNEGNVFVTEAGLVRLIDCDSYQVKNPRGGVFKCEVGTPIWTPPELQGTPFANAPRRIEHDRFGLALLVFHLLFMGRHPYAGVPQNMAAMSDQWTLEWAIKNHQFAYSRAFARLRIHCLPSRYRLNCSRYSRRRLRRLPIPVLQQEFGMTCSILCGG